MFKLDWEKAEEAEIKLPISAESQKKQEFQRNIYFRFTDYTKPFVWITTNWKIFKEIEYETTLTASWEIYMQAKMQQLELDVEQHTGSKFEKEYVKAV